MEEIQKAKDVKKDEFLSFRFIYPFSRQTGHDNGQLSTYREISIPKRNYETK